jgi:hypothetical protein
MEGEGRNDDRAREIADWIDSPSNPTAAVTMSRFGGLSSVIAKARRAPRMSASCAIMNVAPVTKSGASEMAERSVASFSPLSCGLLATATVSRFESLKPPLQIRVFQAHPIELVGSTGAKLAKRAGSRRSEAHCFRVLEVSLDRGDDDARFNSHEIDTDEGNANPCVDDDALVENAIENIDK